MRYSFAATLFLGASLVSSIPLSPNPAEVLRERNVCEPDNLLRLLRNENTLPEAIAFCSGYLHLPPSTITVKTVTPTGTVTETSTVTHVNQVTETVTVVKSYTDTVTDVSTSVTKTTTTDVDTETETVSTTITKQLRRRTGNSTPISIRVATYPPSRISSACNCLTIPLTVTSVTYTVPTVTVTVPTSITTETTVTGTTTTETSTTATETTTTTTLTTLTTETETTTTTTVTVTSTTSLPPAGPTCNTGTAFGYKAQKAINFNGDPVGPKIEENSCKRWGWYFKLTKSELENSISGPLLVGAGGNDVSKATNVGSFVAVVIGTTVTVTYNLNPPYFIKEAHVYVACSVPTTCAPGQYTYSNSNVPNLPFLAAVIPVSPVCTDYYLIVHASVGASSGTCGTVE